MTDQEVIELLDRYEAGQCTPEEDALVKGRNNCFALTQASERPTSKVWNKQKAAQLFLKFS